MHQALVAPVRTGLPRPAIRLWRPIRLTLTTPTCKNIDTKIPYLFDKIQTEISEDFLLRIVPLEIFQYNVNSSEFHKQASRNQYNVLDVWRKELEKRFPSSVRENAFRKMRDVHER